MLGVPTFAAVMTPMKACRVFSRMLSAISVGPYAGPLCRLAKLLFHVFQHGPCFVINRLLQRGRAVGYECPAIVLVCPRRVHDLGYGFPSAFPGRFSRSLGFTVNLWRFV